MDWDGVEQRDDPEGELARNRHHEQVGPESGLGRQDHPAAESPESPRGRRRSSFIIVPVTNCGVLFFNLVVSLV